MKAGWKTVRLAEVAEMRPPKSEVKLKGLKTSDEVGFIPMEDLTLFRKQARALQVRALSEVSSSYTYFANGDVLMAKISPCFQNGKMGIATGLPNGVGYGSSEYFVFRPSKELSAEWLFYFLQDPGFRRHATGKFSGNVGQQRLPKELIEELEIPLPPLAEQKRIAALLDEAFAGIDAAKAKAEASIQSLGTLVVSEFQSLVDDKRFERKLLPELASHTLGKMLDKKKNTGTPRPYLRNVNVRWFDFDLSDIHEMPIRDEEAARCQARKGDVLMCEGGYPGRCAIWSSVEPVFFQKALHRIRFNDKWMAEWFVNYMHSLDSSGKISEFFTGTGIQHLTGETLSKLTIPVPPKSEIETYVKKISTIRDKTNELAANESAKVNALCELKASLLTQAFAGELTA